MDEAKAMPLLDIQNLSVEFKTSGGRFRAVDGVSLCVDAGEIVSIVGESGSGKSVSMLALMGLLPWTATITADRLAFDGQDLLTLSPRQRRKIVGKDMAMIFQEPMSSLNPCFTVGWQIEEVLKVHLKLGRAERRRRAIELLDLVGIPSAAERVDAFPHQMSGGMNQRVMIAMALACNPKLLIADEPTTALDVTIQAQILDLLVRLQKETGMALVLITHDMGVVSETAHRVSVQYAGRRWRSRPSAALLRSPPPLHGRPARGAAGAGDEPAAAVDPGRRARPVRPPRGLPVLAALPVRDRPLRREGTAPPGREGRLRALSLPAGAGSPGRPSRPRTDSRSEAFGMNAPVNPREVLRAEGLSRHYQLSRGPFSKVATVRALAEATFRLEAGRTLAVVGESGCGKSTLARLVSMIEPPTGGTLTVGGETIGAGAVGRTARQSVQIVFQDPYGSLNPRQKVGRILEEPLEINTRLSAAERRAKAEAMMAKVACGPSTTSAIRTCSPAASASASRSPAR